MNERVELSETEWNLIVELLDQEERELPAEIRHTRTPEVKVELHQRLTAVRQLRDRIRGVTA